jgi:shikimate kinase
MRLSFIGMAGTGKSHWSGKFAESGFTRFCCDDMIAAKLAPELKKIGGSKADMGKWMGFPYESQYKERESQYLTYEKEVLIEILSSIERGDYSSHEDIVIDTTGSVIYTGEAILNKLQSVTTVVHLTTPPEVRKTMLEAYLSDPGPVLWQAMYTERPGETTEEALGRSYSRLLITRENLYKQYADVRIDYYKRLDASFGVDDFLATLKSKGV